MHATSAMQRRTVVVVVTRGLFLLNMETMRCILHTRPKVK